MRKPPLVGLARASKDDVRRSGAESGDTPHPLVEAAAVQVPLTVRSIEFSILPRNCQSTDAATEFSYRHSWAFHDNMSKLK